MIDFVIPDNLFFSFFIPFITIVTLTFGILTTLKVFDKKTSMFIAIVIALMVFGGGYYQTITKWISGSGIVLILVFIVVVIIWIGFIGKEKHKRFTGR